MQQQWVDSIFFHMETLNRHEYIKRMLLHLHAFQILLMVYNLKESNEKEKYICLVFLYDQVTIFQLIVH